MALPKTMRVFVGDLEVIINEADFDKAKHKLHKEEPKKEVKKQRKEVNNRHKFKE